MCILLQLSVIIYTTKKGTHEDQVARNLQKQGVSKCHMRTVSWTTILMMYGPKEVKTVVTTRHRVCHRPQLVTIFVLKQMISVLRG